MRSRISLGEFLLKNSKYEVIDKEGRRKFITTYIIPINSATSENYYNHLVDYDLMPICERIKEADFKFTQILENVRTIGNDPTDKSIIYRDLKNATISEPFYNSREDFSYLYDLLAICHFDVDVFEYSETGVIISEKQNIRRRKILESKMETLSPKCIDAITQAEEVIEIAEELIENLRSRRKYKDGSTKILSYKVENCSYIPIYLAKSFTIPRGRVCLDMVIAILIK